MSQPTIKTLRQSGYKVRVIHTRNTEKTLRIGGMCEVISNFGGHTKIEVTTPDFKHSAIGEARCSDKENFNKHIGNSIALGRALDKIQQMQINS